MKTLLQTMVAGVMAAVLLFSVGCSRGEGDRSAGQSIDDAAVTAKVKAAFARDPGVSAIDVNVTTYRGTVQLSGWVNTAEEKAKAEEVAKAIAGVQAVENKLTVKTDVTQPKTP